MYSSPGHSNDFGIEDTCQNFKRFKRVLHSSTGENHKRKLKLQLLATARSLPPLVVELVNAFETFSYIFKSMEERRYHAVLVRFIVCSMMATRSMSTKALRDSFSASAEDVWDEKTHPVLDESKELRGGTINHIINHLTSEHSIGKVWLQVHV